jgi:hypothetical protein
MNAEEAAVVEEHARTGEKQIEVQVVTTSGTFPPEGTVRVPANQPVKVVLKRAQKELEIAETEGWIVMSNGREIDQNRSYAENGLKDSVKLDWGPREGGGGRGVGRNA